MLAGALATFPRPRACSCATAAHELDLSRHVAAGSGGHAREWRSQPVRGPGRLRQQLLAPCSLAACFHSTSQLRRPQCAGMRRVTDALCDDAVRDCTRSRRQLSAQSRQPVVARSRSLVPRVAAMASATQVRSRTAKPNPGWPGAAPLRAGCCQQTESSDMGAATPAAGLGILRCCRQMGIALAGLMRRNVATHGTL